MDIQAPIYSESITQHHILEPLLGPGRLAEYLDRFPDELYHKAPESHLIRLLSILVGPSGVGELRRQAFEQRLITEANGLELFDLDAFYANPFAFGRITEELYEDDPFGLLTREQWETIKAKDEAYRSRAIDFMNGARAGNTPLGMKLVARSGLGHEVEIIENYKYFFDLHSDNPIGLDYYGKTSELQEFIVLPRQETPRNEEQTITITGQPTSGNFVLRFKGEITTPIAYDADLYDVQNALEALPSIGANNVRVRGGPAPDFPFTVRFVNQLYATDVPELIPEGDFAGGSYPDIDVDTTISGLNQEDEVIHVSSKVKHNLQTALDRVRPVTSIPTIGEAQNLHRRQNWKSAVASSEFNEVVRYVTGQPAVPWPPVDSLHWIERNVEKEAPRAVKDMQYHYNGFHNVRDVNVSSYHVGRFNPIQFKRYRYLNSKDDTLAYTGDRITADYFEPLNVTTYAFDSRSLDATMPLAMRRGKTGMINGHYPTNYVGLPETPTIKYKEEQFWASQERPDGPETVELDFGVVRAVNYLYMEVSRKPLDIAIDIDLLDDEEERTYVPVTPGAVFPSTVSYDAGDQNPWVGLEFHFEDAYHRVPFTRYLRITFTRDADPLDFLIDPRTGATTPWSIEARNLRVGRNISNF